MNRLNRIKGPAITDIKSVSLPEIRQFKLGNGIPVYEIGGGIQEVVKIEIVFQSGRPFESKKMVSKAVSYLLKEGTNDMTSPEIAERIDYYGATLKTSTNLDDTRIILYSLSKFLKHVCPILRDILTLAQFPQNELDNYINNSIQNLNIDLSKDEFRAYRILTENIFGSEHPYGYNSSADLYFGIKREDLVDHYQSAFGIDNCEIFISGHITDEVRLALEESCGTITNRSKVNVVLPDIITGPSMTRVPTDNKHQTAIRIGKRLFNRRHPDFPALFFVTTLLGGYFGSRLMTNLREDKGYTYSVYAGLDDFVYDGYFYISADVGNEHVSNSIKEIRYELKALMDKPVSTEEMRLVRNYLMGNLLNMLDGPFNQAQVVRTLVTKHCELGSFNNFVGEILGMTSENVQIAAQKYLNPDSMISVLVGGSSK